MIKIRNLSGIITTNSTTTKAAAATSNQQQQQQQQSSMDTSGGVIGGDWRSQLQPESRQRIVNKVLETLKRHLPFSGEEGFLELKRIAVRFEEKIYTAATSQPDYDRKISMKMLTMETKSRNQNQNANSMPSNPVGNGRILRDPGCHRDSEGLEEEMGVMEEIDRQHAAKTRKTVTGETQAQRAANAPPGKRHRSSNREGHLTVKISTIPPRRSVDTAGSVFLEHFHRGQSEYRNVPRAHMTLKEENELLTKQFGTMLALHNDTRENSERTLRVEISQLELQAETAKDEAATARRDANQLRDEIVSIRKEWDEEVKGLQEKVKLLEDALRNKVAEAAGNGLQMYERGYEIHQRQLQIHTSCSHWRDLEFVFDVTTVLDNTNATATALELADTQPQAPAVLPAARAEVKGEDETA